MELITKTINNNNNNKGTYNFNNKICLNSTINRAMNLKQVKKVKKMLLDF